MNERNVIESNNQSTARVAAIPTTMGPMTMDAWMMPPTPPMVTVSVTVDGDVDGTTTTTTTTRGDDKAAASTSYYSSLSGREVAASSKDELDFDLLFMDDEKRTEEDPSSMASSSAADVGFDVGAVVIRCARLMCAPRSEEEYQTLRALKRASRAMGLESFKDDSRAAEVREGGLETLALRLKMEDPVRFRGLDVAASDSSADVADACKRLAHSYLWLPPFATNHRGEVYASMDERVIIEPNLRSHFVVGRASSAYKRLVDALPECFVGSYAQLTEVVHFVSTHMMASFRESGLDIPPWRRPGALTSKWTLAASSAQQSLSASSSPGSPMGPFDSTSFGATTKTTSVEKRRSAAKFAARSDAVRKLRI